MTGGDGPRVPSGSRFPFVPLAPDGLLEGTFPHPAGRDHGEPRARTVPAAPPPISGPLGGGEPPHPCGTDPPDPGILLTGRGRTLGWTLGPPWGRLPEPPPCVGGESRDLQRVPGSPRPAGQPGRGRELAGHGRSIPRKSLEHHEESSKRPEEGSERPKESSERPKEYLERPKEGLERPKEGFGASRGGFGASPARAERAPSAAPGL